MDCKKVGELIQHLRKSKLLTQRELAEIMNISDKAVSKWERGLGCPDVSLLPELSKALGVNIEQILSGEIEFNDVVGGNMKKSKFYVCPKCGNLTVCTGNAEVHCCGASLTALTPQKAESKLNIEECESDWYITSDHEMTKEHYISFIAHISGDKLSLIKLYPEWNMQARFSRNQHGTLLWYCTQHGLFYTYL